jgi:tetratricopeptide (TPR) repeat protein
MRNRNNAWMLGVSLALWSIAAGGCGPDQKAKQVLDESAAALENRDSDEAIMHAQVLLDRAPSGPGTAEALYLQGLAHEQKVAGSAVEARANLQAARDAYTEAFAHQPSPQLKAYLHTSLANVAYFQDDYATALREWSTAYDLLSDDAVKSWVLYRIGLCRQRSGQFAEADQILVAVQEKFPNTIPAQRAKEKYGARSFSVQIATFANSTAADTTIATLRQEGASATRRADARGNAVVFVGPVKTYQQALAMKNRYAGRYPDAVIVP